MRVPPNSLPHKQLNKIYYFSAATTGSLRRRLQLQYLVSYDVKMVKVSRGPTSIRPQNIDLAVSLYATYLSYGRQRSDVSHSTRSCKFRWWTFSDLSLCCYSTTGCFLAHTYTTHHHHHHNRQHHLTNSTNGHAVAFRRSDIACRYPWTDALGISNQCRRTENVIDYCKALLRFGWAAP